MTVPLNLGPQLPAVLSQDQRALFAAYPLLRRVATLLRIAAREAPHYGPAGRTLLAQVLAAAALTCAVIQEECAQQPIYFQRASGQLGAQCRRVAEALRATTYQTTATGTGVLGAAGLQALGLFAGIDLLTLPTSPQDTFAATYLPQAGVPARVDLVAALTRLFDNFTP